MATPPSDLVSPPSDLVSAGGPPTDLVKPPSDLIGGEVPQQHYTAADIPDTIKVAPYKEPSLEEKIIGAGEAAVGIVTGIPAQVLGGLQGVTSEALSGKMGTAEGEREAEKYAAEFSSRYSYQPRTEAGQAALEEAGDIMAPLMFLGPEATPHVIPTAKYLVDAGRVKLSDMQIKKEAAVSGVAEPEVKAITKPSEIKQTAFRHKTSGEITLSGDQHDVGKKGDPNLEPGFVDGQGNFLGRMDALKRARETGQIEEDHQLEFPEEGLHSGDLKAAAQKQSPIVAAADNLARERVNSLLAASRFIRNTSKVINDAIPKGEDREAISEAIDRGEIENLPDETHRTVAQHVKERFKEIGERAQQLGIIDGLRENYISHIVDWSKVPKNEVGRLKELLLGETTRRENTTGKTRFGKERKYDTFEALQEAIKNTGLSIKTKDVSEIYKAYASSMERAIANQKMIDALKKLQTKDGEGVQWAVQKVTEGVNPPIGWKYINHPQMRGYVVNPELEPMINFVFENYEPGAIMRGATMLNQATKRMNVVGSFFHAKSLLEAQLANLGPVEFAKQTGLTVYDIFRKTQYAGITKALNQFHNGGLGDLVDKWLKAGINLEIPEDISLGVILQVGRVADETLGRLGIKTEAIGKTAGGVEKATLGIFDKVTWDYLQTGLKLSVAEKLLETAKKADRSINEDQVRREIARHINNSFGGQNWYDAATHSSSQLGREILMQAFSPKGRAYLQLLMFAPDWSVSTIKAFTSALPRSMDIKGGLKGLKSPKTQADFARRYQLRTAIIYATLINGMQMSLTGKSILSNQDPTRLEFPDGTSMQLMKHAAEPYHWMADFDQTFANKLGFIPRAAIMGLGGLQYASPYAPKLQDLSVAGRTKAALEQALPFQVSAGVQAPTGEGLKRAIAGTLGFPIYGSTKAQKAKARKELKKAQDEAIRKWKKEHKQ